VGLFVRTLGAEVARDSAIIIEPNPFGFLIDPAARGDVEATDLPIIEGVACGGLVKGVLVVKDSLFQAMEVIFVLFGRYGSVGFPIGDGLEEAVSNTLEEGGVQVGLGL
jgi:hypothetical protein